MKGSPTAGLLLYSTAALLIILVLAIFNVTFWEIIGLSYLIPFAIVGIVASARKMVHQRQQKKYLIIDPCG